ncbi:MAG: TetR/AcrR family transcriptional regulator [Alphaproteobacteria bacterium]
MPRAIGQIDRVKSEAILNAAGRILADQGFSAPMSAIARAAGVSKQTIYNHFGTKSDLVRAIIARRAGVLTAPLDAPGALDHPLETLQAYARMMLELIVAPGGLSLMRLIIQSSGDMPDLARDVYDTGPKTARARLARFLAAETKAGRLACEDPAEAAELFTGMAIGHRQLAGLIGLPSDMDSRRMDTLAHTVATRFVRAYAP